MPHGCGGPGDDGRDNRGLKSRGRTVGGRAMIGEAFPMKRFLLSPVSARTGRQYLYALVCAPLGIAGFVYAVVTLAVGGALSFTFVGLPLIALAIFLPRT